MSAEDAALALAESEVLVAEVETAAPATDSSRLALVNSVKSESIEEIQQVITAGEIPSSTKARNWQVQFGPVIGRAGDLLKMVYSIRGSAIFRGQRIVATDTASPAGCGTRIERLLVNDKSQNATVALKDRLLPPAVPTGGVLSVFANREVLTDVGDMFELSVYFIESCTFEMIIIGKALV